MSEAQCLHSRRHVWLPLLNVEMQAFLGLGLPAAIAVSVCLTGEDATIRDSDPKNSGVFKRARGAVLCRVAPSFLRFGSFELPARRGDVELVRKLADHCVRHLVSYLDSNRPAYCRDLGDERKGPTGLAVPPRTGQEIKMSEKEYPKEDYLGLLVAIVEVGPSSSGMQYSQELTPATAYFNSWFVVLPTKSFSDLQHLSVRWAACTT